MIAIVVGEVAWHRMQEIYPEFKPTRFVAIRYLALMFGFVVGTISGTAVSLFDADSRHRRIVVGLILIGLVVTTITVWNAVMFRLEADAARMFWRSVRIPNST